MGQWETERGKGSDAMADILGAAFRKIGNLPEEPTVFDLADAIEFVSRGMLVVELHDDVPEALIEKHVKFIELLEKQSIFMTIRNRGQVRPPEKRPPHHF